MNKLSYKMCVVFAAMVLVNAGCQEKQKTTSKAGQRGAVIEKMKAYDGPSQSGVDTGTLKGKIICEYRGGFTCPGDGSELGWSGWGKDGKFDEQNCGVDLWPDMTEYEKDECFASPFKNADGSTAYVFSSMNKKTVLRHFKWMSDYGIDGVFVERLNPQVDTRKELILCNHMWWMAAAPRSWRPFDAPTRNFRNTVLANCREGANMYGRAYAIKYDISGLKAGQMRYVIADWKLLVDNMKLTKDPQDKAYLRHNGKPVVAIWGIGFKDKHEYSLKEVAEFVDFLKNDPDYGGCTVVVGVPTWWRTLYNDCLDDAMLHKIVMMADIVSPWTVGRFEKAQDVPGFASNIWGEDMDWCKKENKQYMPVVWPGFSWHNTFGLKSLDGYRRVKGELLSEQFSQAKSAGSEMIYLASFDNLQEGTAILKCTNNPPSGKTGFVTYEGLPSEHYLQMAGQAGEMFKK